MTWTLHRIDDRLIHGQVVVAWGQRLNPKRIWVVDDASAANDWERDLLAMSAPGVDVRVTTIAAAVAAHAEEAIAPGGAFLLVRSLPAAQALVEAGARISAFNVGGLHYAPGKDRLGEYVYLDEDDREAARALRRAGVELYVQDIPAAPPQPLESLDPTVAPSEPRGAPSEPRRAPSQ
jgi:mannose/fructose/N-acetylgalactosamine-specific phosphotransferase system component IIB